ncbi:MAG TPA: HAD-IIIC family phosphatase [Pirellulales bacterium]|jgi:FkbH-like protein|nr:HAD-IIIC family phosphatase [Pirellulales bacterium]
MSTQVDRSSPELSLQNLSLLRKQGRTDDALRFLEGELRRGNFDAEETDQAGRFIRREIERGSLTPTLRVLILGQCTTSWLATKLTAVAYGRGTVASVSDGGYDNVLQELDRQATEGDLPDAVVLLPWNQRLLSSGGNADERIDDELRFWSQAWSQVDSRLRCRLIQVGYDWMSCGCDGYGLGVRGEGTIERVRRMNAALRQHLPSHAFFVDLECVAGMLGRDTFYDPRGYAWAKQPFSEAGTLRLAEHLWGGLRALTTGPKKVLVLDLDNTLWGGVVGETGPLGVGIGDTPDGEGFLAFQRHVKGLARQGVLLAVASKNNAADAREPFEHNPDMLLKLDDFAAFESHWEPKAESLRRIAETLQLGLDSFVFFDDNPAEREHIHQALPEVEVVEVPVEPAEYVRALAAGQWFETNRLTEADQARGQQYVAERQRRECQQSFGNLSDYLRSLEMTAAVRLVDGADLDRVVQLLAKTNQFNLTTRRHSRAETLALLETPRSICFSVRMRDKFGDHGLVAVVLAVPADDADVMRIDTWLMSCRVIGRTLESFTLSELATRAGELGFRQLLGEYVETKKNGLVRDVYERHGFSPAGEAADSPRRFMLALGPQQTFPETFVAAGE